MEEDVMTTQDVKVCRQEWRKKFFTAETEKARITLFLNLNQWFGDILWVIGTTEESVQTAVFRLLKKEEDIINHYQIFCNVCMFNKFDKHSSIFELIKYLHSPRVKCVKYYWQKQNTSLPFWIDPLTRGCPMGKTVCSDTEIGKPNGSESRITCGMPPGTP